jgi:hypothetical protein
MAAGARPVNEYPCRAAIVFGRIFPDADILFAHIEVPQHIIRHEAFGL